jgi:hypothetical protein
VQFTSPSAAVEVTLPAQAPFPEQVSVQLFPPQLTVLEQDSAPLHSTFILSAMPLMASEQAPEP